MRVKCIVDPSLILLSWTALNTLLTGAVLFVSSLLLDFCRALRVRRKRSAGFRSRGFRLCWAALFCTQTFRVLQNFIWRQADRQLITFFWAPSALWAIGA
jgi:hypothetical protein